MRLIDNWRKAWKMSSIQLAALTAILNASAAGWVAFDGHIPPIAWASVNMVLGIAVAAARVILQPKLEIPE